MQNCQILVAEFDIICSHVTTCCLDRPVSFMRHFYRASYASTVGLLAVIGCLSVRLFVCVSVCPSVCHKSECCTKTAKPRITLTTPYNSAGTQVFRRQKSRRTNDITPTGAPNRGGVGSHRRFSTNISLYLRNGAR